LPCGWGQTRASGASPPGIWAAPPQARSTMPHGTWAAYTFSVITSIGIKNIIISFLIILFLV